jgi:hypothetical protein
MANHNIQKENPELKLKGRSGCELNILEGEEGVVVRKSSVSAEYNERLKKQAEKQQAYYNRKSTLLQTPKVINSGYSEGNVYYFEMEYVKGEKFSDFFSRATVDEINRLFLRFKEYFDELFESATTKPADIKSIEEKILDVKTKLDGNDNFSVEFKNAIINKLSSCIPTEDIPLASCHGDFTFSNILVTSIDNIYTFDFLDSFIESPIIDLVKIRQDTKFFWSVEIDDKLDLGQKCRVLQVLKYLDIKFENYLQSHFNKYSAWYNYLELFNLVRIMPYAQNIRDIYFLTKNIKPLL